MRRSIPCLLFASHRMIIVLMFICICNAITESHVRSAVAEGASSLSDLQAQLGVATCCGCCAETVAEYLPGGRHADHASGEYGLNGGVLAGAAANDARVSTVELVEVVARRA
jgi:bacterioferritin-associated ferredoxin